MPAISHLLCLGCAISSSSSTVFSGEAPRLKENGSEKIVTELPGGHISTVNTSEFTQKLNQYGDDGARALEKLEEIGLLINDFTQEDSHRTAALYPALKPYGLSLADRACLALALRLDAEVYTADKIWLKVSRETGLTITSIR
jgi:PIN domain nuclease of toxin-antitoxin system